MFRLKGLCYQRLGHDNEAKECFSRSVQVSSGRLAKGWLSWSHVCYEGWKHDKPSSDKGLSAMVCVLKAVEGECEPARVLLPRVLWMLEHAAACLEQSADHDQAPGIEKVKGEGVKQDEGVGDDTTATKAAATEDSTHTSSSSTSTASSSSSSSVLLLEGFASRSLTVPLAVWLPFVSNLVQVTDPPWTRPYISPFIH